MYVITKKQIFRFFSIFLSAVVVAVALFFIKSPKDVFTSSLKTDWGLSYREKGKKPVGNADADYLK